jgi:hypothetical protein
MAAAGMKVELVPGSVEDAKSLLRRRDLNINYLDLRNATAAQALDWILRLARMGWNLDGDKVIAGSARRSTEPTPWVYDVAAIALTEATELEGDHNEKINRRHSRSRLRD